MSGLETAGQSTVNSKNRTCIKLGVYFILVISLMVSFAYMVNAVGNNVTNLTISPDPIKLEYYATINYTLGVDSSVNALVYTESGELIRSLLSNVPKPAGTNRVTWNGYDDNGVLVPDGNYRISVESTDAGGAQTGLAEKTVTAARSPVITNVSDTPDPFNPLAGETANFNYTISSDAVVTLKIFKGSTTVINTITSSEINPAGNYTIQWDGRDSTGLVVGDASYIYQLQAVSPVVAEFSSTYKNLTDVEKELPQITGLAVSQNPLKLGVSYQNFKFTLSEAADVTVKVYDSANNLVRTVTSGQARNAGVVSIYWDGKDDAGILVPEGSYTGVVYAVDKYGNNSGDNSISFTAAYQPIISNAAVNPNPYNPGAGSGAINYNISADALVTVKILSGTTTVVRTIVENQSQSAGDQLIAWDGKDSNGQFLGDGSYYLQVTAVSPTVSTFTSNVKVPFSVAGAVLEISDFTLSPNPFKISLNYLSIKGTLSESATIDVKVYQGSTLIQQPVSGQYRNAGSFTAVWDGKDTTGNYVPEGTYSVSVGAVDASGNAVEVWGTATGGYQPAITGVTSSPEPFDPAAGEAVINFTLSSDANVTVNVLDGLNAIRSFTPVLLKAGGNSVTWDGKDDSQQGVDDGSYTYNITAASPTVSEFNASYRGTVIVEGKDPVLSNLYVSPTTVKIGSSAYFRYTVSEPATTTAQVLKAADRSVVIELPPDVRPSGGSSAIPWDTKDSTGNLVDSGDYILKLNAVDNYSKTGSAELPFTAGTIPVVTNVYANPATLDLSQGSQVTISYDITERSYVTVKIFDANNALIKTIYSYKEFPAGTATAVWDCKNTLGETMTGSFIAQVSVTSVIGSFRGEPASTTFEVLGSSNPTTGSCRDCHTTYPTEHPMTNCDGCHKNDEPVQDCRQCHGGSHNYSVLSSYQCTDCHNETYSYKIPFHEGDINVLHEAPLTADCQDCHNPSLNVEHPLHTNDSGQSYDCNTCHQSTVADVVYAIDTGQKNCSSCHQEAGHNEVHTPTGIQPGCTDCHIDSLTQEHLNNPTTQTGNTWTCDTCHASTVEGVITAIDQGLKNCDACHTISGHQQFHDTNNLDSNCLTCHDNNLSYEHLENINTQKDEAGNFAPKDCATCHTSSQPAVTAAVDTANTQCAACHRTGHNVSFVENVPAYVYKYPGFDWTPPQDAFLWAGESWMPSDYEIGGKVIISNRRLATADGVVDTAYGSVFDYYNTKLTADGWTLVSPLPAQPDFFQVTYEKGTHWQTIWFCGGSGHTASPVLDSGYRIEVIYK